MVFLCWSRPSPNDQKDCIDKSGGFNYDSQHRGASLKSLSALENNVQLSKDGYFLNHTRISVGSGVNTYEKGKAALQTWRQFALDWAFVDPKTPVKTGTKFCVCVKQFFPWMMMPLEVACVNENKDPKSLKASFGFSSGTLHGHLLSGEERFSVELDENGEVWYEVLSFSKPAHFLSAIGYPYIKLRQNSFALQSAHAVLKHVTAQQPSL